MNFPSKAISVLLLVQCLFIWMGYLLTRRFTRVPETIASTVEEVNLFKLHMPNSVRLVLGMGLWALLIPLALAAWICLRSESHQRIPMVQVVDTNITLVLTFVTVGFWSYGAAISIAYLFAFNSTGCCGG